MTVQYCPYCGYKLVEVVIDSGTYGERGYPECFNCGYCGDEWINDDDDNEIDEAYDLFGFREENKRW